MANSRVERRWIEINGEWRLMKINEQDARYELSVAYDPTAEDNGKPSVTLAELREDKTHDADGLQVSHAARTPAAKKTAAAKKAAKPAAGDGASSGDGDQGDGGSDAPPAQ